MEKSLKENAQKICDLTGFGQALHPNDILPELHAPLVSLLKSLREGIIDEKLREDGVLMEVNFGKAKTIRDLEDMCIENRKYGMNEANQAHRNRIDELISLIK